MTTLREAAQQALEALELGYDSAKAEANQYHAAMAGYKPQRHAQMDADVQKIAVAITALRAALAQEQAEPAQQPEAVTEAERLRKDAERYRWLRDEDSAFEAFTAAYYNAQAPADIDAALDAAMATSGGWCGPRAEPVQEPVAWYQKRGQEVLTSHPACWGREDEPWTPLYTAPPKAEPAQEPGAWVASKDGRVIYDDTSADDGLLRVSGDFENDEQRLRYAQRIVDALNAASPKAKPVQKNEMPKMPEGRQEPSA